MKQINLETVRNIIISIMSVLATLGIGFAVNFTQGGGAELLETILASGGAVVAAIIGIIQFFRGNPELEEQSFGTLSLEEQEIVKKEQKKKERKVSVLYALNPFSHIKKKKAA